MKFVPYKGKDKYHFRRYFKSKNHPAIIVDVQANKEGHIYLCCYVITHSIRLASQMPSKVFALSLNPNPADGRQSFVVRKRIGPKRSNEFGSPIEAWKLSEEDKTLIDSWEEKRKKK